MSTPLRCETPREGFGTFRCRWSRVYWSTDGSPHHKCPCPSYHRALNDRDDRAIRWMRRRVQERWVPFSKRRCRTCIGTDSGILYDKEGNLELMPFSAFIGWKPLFLEPVLCFLPSSRRAEEVASKRARAYLSWMEGARVR